MGFCHHRVDFGNGNFSGRILLPKDGSRVKVTIFHGESGSIFPGLVDSTDEVVYVLSGRVKVTTADRIPWDSEEGGLYYIPAGESRTVEILETADLLCFFSQAGDGAPLPDDK